MARFEFDYDATWTAFFADSQLRIYSRYGGRDENDPEARLSKPSLLQTMREVLSAHRVARQERPTESIQRPDKPLASAGPIWHPEPKVSALPSQIPLLKKSHQGCVHCHQLREYSLLQAYHDGRFRRELLFPFPLPENVGIEIDRTHGHRALRIRPGSVAESAGLKNGDVITQAADVPIRSELDLRWAWHRLPFETKSVELRIQRDASQTITINLPLLADWRAGELSWRKSTRSIPADWGFRAAALTPSQRLEANLPADGLAIRILSVKPRGFAAAFQLQKDDIILEASPAAVDQQRSITPRVDQSTTVALRHRTLEQFRSDLLRHFAPGEKIQLKIHRANQPITISASMPNWFTEETSVP